MLDFRKLELNTTEPVYVQIVSFVKRQIFTGAAEKGESLPSRRELAAILKINPNTVQKAFRLMEEEKIIETPPHAVSVIHWDDTVFARLRRELTAGLVADFVAQAKENGLKESFVDRLRVTEKVLGLMAEGARQTAALPDPVGEISEMRRRPSGIQVGRMRVPLGVLGIIYESRPNVTVDAACLAVKSGNDPKTGRAYTPLVRMLYNEQEIAFRSECTPIADGSTWYKLTELKSCLASDHQTLGDDAHLTDDSTTQPGTGPNTGEGTSTTPNNNGAGTHQPSNTQANGTENELSRTGVAVTGVAGIMMLLALAGISLNLWKVRR